MALVTEYRHIINCMLLREEEGMWSSWCPDLDVMSQGQSPNEAIAMLEDAVRIAAESDLAAWTWEGFARKPKRVTHPLRRGKTAVDDESWAKYEHFKNYIDGEHPLSDRYAQVDLDHLDRFPNEPHAFVLGSLLIRSRAGVVSVQVEFSAYSDAYVPAIEQRVRVKVSRIKDVIIKRPSVMAQDMTPAEREQYVRKSVWMSSDEQLEAIWDSNSEG